MVVKFTTVWSSLIFFLFPLLIFPYGSDGKTERPLLLVKVLQKSRSLKIV